MLQNNSFYCLCIFFSKSVSPLRQTIRLLSPISWSNEFFSFLSFFRLCVSDHDGMDFYFCSKNKISDKTSAQRKRNPFRITVEEKRNSVFKLTVAYSSFV